MSAGRQSRISNNAACGAGGGKKSTKRLKFFFPKVWFKRSECRGRLQQAYRGEKIKAWHICRSSTTRVFVAAVAVGGWIGWRWNGGWVSVHSIVSSHMCEARRTGSAEHSPRDMSEKAAPLVTALAWWWEDLLDLRQRRWDLIHESSIRYSRNIRVTLVCWRLRSN